MNSAIKAAVTVVGMGNEECRSWRGVMGYGDVFCAFREHGRVVIDISDGDIDLSTAVDRMGSCVELYGQKNIREGLVVQGPGSGDDARLGIH